MAATTKSIRKEYPRNVQLTAEVSISNRVGASAIMDLHYKRYLKILSKLLKPIGEYNLKEFSDVTSSEDP